MDIQINWEVPEEAGLGQWPSCRGQSLSPAPPVPPHWNTHSPTARAAPCTHLGVLDPDGAWRQCLCHHLALGSDNCDRLIDCAPWKGQEQLNRPKPQQCAPCSACPWKNEVVAYGLWKSFQTVTSTLLVDLSLPGWGGAQPGLLVTQCGGRLGEVGSPWAPSLARLYFLARLKGLRQRSEITVLFTLVVSFIQCAFIFPGRFPFVRLCGGFSINFTPSFSALALFMMVLTCNVY